MAKASSLDTLLDRFEEAWQQPSPPRLEDFWRQVQQSARATDAQRKALSELVKIDLHRRWKEAVAQPASARPFLESYLRRFPALGTAPQLPVAMIVEEYSARKCAGEAVGHQEYFRRFPAQADALRTALPGVDVELGPTPAPPPQTSDGSTEERLPAILSAQGMLDCLLELALLEPKQLEHVSRPQFRARLVDCEALVGFFRQHRWLTDYQLEQLALGKRHRLAVGRYVLLDRLGEGATSVVFKARHRHLDRIVALKIVRKELLRDVAPPVLERLYQEFRAVGRLSHPHVVHAYDAGPIGSALFIAMEYVGGMNLRDLVQQQGGLPHAQAGAYARQACAALGHAAENGIIHRDVKPSNLVLAGAPGTASHPWGIVKLLDLGLARIHSLGQAHSSTMLTQKGAIMGTADYMAPEQALDAHDVDVRADLYSLGCTLYFLLAGRPPFAKGTFVQKLEKHRLEQPEPIEHLCHGLPADVVAVVHRLLAKDPADRFQSPAEVYVALGGDPATMPATADTVSFSLTLSSPALPPAPAPLPAAPVLVPRASRRWLLPASLAIGVVVLAVALLGLAALRSRRSADKPGHHPVVAEQPVLEPVLAIDCGKKRGEVRVASPRYGYRLIQGKHWDAWPVAPPARSYCWFHETQVHFEVLVPRGTTGVLRLGFFDGDRHDRSQKLLVQDRLCGDLKDFASVEKVVELPITANDTATGTIDVKIDRLNPCPNLVISSVEFLERHTVSAKHPSAH